MAKLNMDALKGSIKDREKRKEDEDRRRDKANQKYASLSKGVNYLKMMPPHKNMDGVPWVHRRMHWNLGPDENIPATCLRDDDNHPLETCPACKDSYNLFKADEKERGKQIRVKPREVMQLVNVTDWIKEHGFDEALPDCLFLEYEEGNKKCKKCAMYESCPNGIELFTMPVSVSDFIISDFGELISEGKDKTLQNIIKFNSGILYQIEKKQGKAKINVDYVNIKRIKKKGITFSDETVEWMKENLHDLTVLTEKLSFDDLRNLMDEGTTLPSEDEESENDIPECYGNPDEFSKKKKRCKKCDVMELCEQDVEEDDEDGDTEEDKPSKKNKSTKKNKQAEEEPEDTEQEGEDDEDEPDEEDIDEDEDEDEEDEEEEDDEDEEEEDDEDEEEEDEDDEEEEDGPNLDELKAKLEKENAKKKKASKDKKAKKKGKKKK